MAAIDQRRVQAWLDQLADLTASGAEPVTPSKLATMAAMLMGDGLPNAAFCSDSLRAIAKANRFFPAYSDLSTALRTWWAQHRPPVAVLPGQDDAGTLDQRERSWLVFWNTRRPQILDPGYIPQRGSVEADLQSLASLIRQEAPKAWRIIAGPERGVPVPTAAQVEQVSEKLREHFAERLKPSALVEAPEKPMRDVAFRGAELEHIRAQRSARA